MKKAYFILSIIIVNLNFIFAQGNAKPKYSVGTVDTSQRFFYKTFKDVINQIPSKGIKYGGQRKNVAEVESIKVIRNGVIAYEEVKNLAYWGCVDEYGQLQRFYKSNSYYFLSFGKVCTYIKGVDAQISTDKNGKLQLSHKSKQIPGYVDYISKGPEGELENFTENKFAAATQDHPEILFKYKNDLKSLKEPNKRVQTTFKIAKYATEYNGMK